jgi:TetR/AcrR family transcriptional repressor of nem operon
MVQNYFYICVIMARKIEFLPEEKVARAMDVFWSEGYNAASLYDLTAAMKINKSSLYNTIGDKHTLFKECLKAYYDKLVEQDFNSAISKGTTGLEKLNNIVDKIVAVTLERKYACFGIKSSFELAAMDEEVRDIIKAANEKRIGLVKSLIKEAQLSGDIKPHKDADLMAYFFIYSFTGLQQSAVIHNRKMVKNMGNEIKAYLKS